MICNHPSHTTPATIAFTCPVLQTTWHSLASHHRLQEDAWADDLVTSTAWQENLTNSIHPIWSHNWCLYFIKRVRLCTEGSLAMECVEAILNRLNWETWLLSLVRTNTLKHENALEGDGWSAINSSEFHVYLICGNPVTRKQKFHALPGLPSSPLVSFQVFPQSMLCLPDVSILVQARSPFANSLHSSRQRSTCLDGYALCPLL